MDAELLHHSLRSIFDSYHAPDQDVLVEIIQNSVDALEERAELEKGKRFIPKLKLMIDTAKNTVEIVDNGVGVPSSVLEALGTPHNTSKHEKRRRGHKGVGLTFAAWSTERFQFATKRLDWADVEAGRLEGASIWLENGKGPCPVIEADKPYGKILSGEDAGTAFKFTFSSESKVLSTIRRLRREGVVAFLRARTALGYVGLPEIHQTADDWVTRVKIEVWVDGEKLNFSEMRYAYPHEFVEDRYSLDLEKLDSVSPHLISKYERKHKFIYKIIRTDEVIHFLEGSEDASTLKHIAARQHVAVYCAFADQKATFDSINEKFYKSNPGQGKKAQILGPGIQIATANMPVGKFVEVSLKFGTGNKNRILAVVEFDDVRPDFGRKTFQGAIEDIAQIVVARLVTELVQSRKFLIPHATPHGDTPTEQEEELGKLRELAEQRQALAIKGLTLVTEPKYEQEVLGLFFALTATGRLPGYEIIACPGSSRKYDALFNFEISKPLNMTVPPELAIADEKFPKQGNVRFQQKILEFKLSAEELLYDFDEDVKRPKDIFLLVCWDLGRAEAFEGAGIALERLQDHGLPHDIVGETHTLEYNGHLIHVIALKDMMPILAARQLQGASRMHSADARI